MTSARTGTDSAAPLRAAARHGVLGLAALTVAAAVIAGLVVGAPGVWAALLGAAVGGGFVLFTVAVVLGTARSEPTTMAAVLLGSWLLKLVVLIGVLAVLRRFDFYDRTTFGVVILAAAVGLLALETRAIVRTRAVYVDASPSVADAPATGGGGAASRARSDTR